VDKRRDFPCQSPIVRLFKKSSSSLRLRERLPRGGGEATEAESHLLRDEDMSYAVVKLILTILDLYWWVVIVSVILSWLVAFDVLNTRSQAAQTIWRTVDTLTEPLLRPIRSVLPAVGGLDISPLILLLALQFLRDVVERTMVYG